MKFASGLPETACGLGSALKSTEHIRGELPGLLHRLGAAVLLDAPCGDLNWISHVDLSTIDYIGCDFDREHLVVAKRRKVAMKSRCLLMRDIILDSLPGADVMLCREFLQHLPYNQVEAVLVNFLESGARWLLATSHGNSENYDIAKMGMFRPLNLLKEPFSLCAPYFSIIDPPGQGAILGVWDREAIMESFL